MKGKIISVLRDVFGSFRPKKKKKKKGWGVWIYVENWKSELLPLLLDSFVFE